MSPLYTLPTAAGNVVIDVTTSVSAGLGPSSVLTNVIIPYFKENDVERILDFGAGALRHSLPLLDEGFDVSAVDFKEGFERPVSTNALSTAKKHKRFRSITPRDFLQASRKYDAALLCYVLQTMPLPAERTLLLNALFNIVKKNGFLFYMGRLNQLPATSDTQAVSDGYFMYPERAVHSFYREFSTSETHEMIQDVGFKKIRFLSQRGTDQVYLYAKGNITWTLT